MHVRIKGATSYAPIKTATIHHRDGLINLEKSDAVLLVLDSDIFIGHIIKRGEQSLQVIDQIIPRQLIRSIDFEYDAIPDHVWDSLTTAQPHPPLYYEYDVTPPENDPYKRGKPDLN